MSLFTFFSEAPDSQNPLTSTEFGNEAFKYFHNESLKYADYGNRTFQQSLNEISRFGKPYVSPEMDLKLVNIFLDGLGTSILRQENNGLLDNNGLQTAMEALADKSQGRLPTASSFFTAISDVTTNPSFITTLENVVPAVGSEIVDGAVAVGDSVITTGKWALWLLPIVVIAGGLFLVQSKVRKMA